MTDNDARASILECQVNESLAGHDLGPFEPVTDRVTGGFEAKCRRCGQTGWVGDNGLMYGLLGDDCSGNEARA
jgi:hypothetical protein